MLTQLLAISMVNALNVPMYAKTDYFQVSDLNSTFRLVSAVLLLIGGALYFLWGIGKISFLNEKQVITAAAAACAGIVSFLCTKLLLDNVEIVMITSVVAGCTLATAFFVWKKDMKKVGYLGCGSLLGFVVAIVLAPIVGNLLQEKIARLAFILVITFGLGAYIMQLDGKWIKISAIIAGAFGFVYEADYFVIHSNFSQIVRVAVGDVDFAGFTTRTSGSTLAFIVLSIFGIYLIRNDVFK